MNLSKELLKEYIERITQEKDIDAFIIEKDYYVTALVKEIVSRDFNFIFKGGTSLSKCYKLINRFSEDIDLNYDYHGDIPSKAKRFFINEIIEESAKKIGLTLTNNEKVIKDNDYIKYQFSYSKLYNSIGYLKPDVEVETAFFLDSNPTEIKKANSIVGEYLLEHKEYEIINKYHLQDFDVKVQSYKRTFIDKIFAICDYYYESRSRFTSRHLYDLYKLIDLIEFDRDFYILFDNVRQKRINRQLGHQYEIDKKVSSQLQEIIDSNFYKEDYDTNTSKICIDNISYKEAIDNLKNIISNLK